MRASERFFRRPEPFCQKAALMRVTANVTPGWRLQNVRSCAAGKVSYCVQENVFPRSYTQEHEGEKD
jgi:hypothetical protein